MRIRVYCPPTYRPIGISDCYPYLRSLTEKWTTDSFSRAHLLKSSSVYEFVHSKDICGSTLSQALCQDRAPSRPLLWKASVLRLSKQILIIWPILHLADSSTTFQFSESLEDNCEIAPTPENSYLSTTKENKS